MTHSCTVGIDIGGTKMAVAAVDATHHILARTVLPTEAGLGFSRAVDRLSAAIREVARAAGGEVSGVGAIGIGCAGPVDSARGWINNPYTLEGWDRCDIVTPLQERFEVPVRLENDADVAAVGEWVAGAGQGASPLVMLTFGTGIGGAAILDGRIHRGVRGEHPELGHVPVEADGPSCYCGLRGCLESIASGTAIGEAGRARGWRDARAVFAAAAAGRSEAIDIVERAARATATAAWTLCHTLLPQRLILGGGMMETEFERFAGVVRSRLASATQFTKDAVDIVPAALGNDAGVVGAAAVARGALAEPPEPRG